MDTDGYWWILHNMDKNKRVGMTGIISRFHGSLFSSLWWMEAILGCSRRRLFFSFWLIRTHKVPSALVDISVIIRIYFWYSLSMFVFSSIYMYQLVSTILIHYELGYLTATLDLPQVQGSCATEVEITFETWSCFMMCSASVKRPGVQYDLTCNMIL